MNLIERKQLDKFFTKSDIAKLCYEEYKKILPKDICFIEPSAGNGSFLNIIEENKIGFDLVPEHKDIIQNDFLKDDISKHVTKETVFIGNPPFGKKSKLAIEFVNKCLSYSDYVGFIVPIQFRKWSVQNNIKDDAKLLLDIDLIPNAFELNGKDYIVRCCFQVWSNVGSIDLRLKKPSLDHVDFQMYQYNRTKDALKYFDYDWDFAVIRQGFQDYNKKVFDKVDCDKKQQWIFFKANNKQVLDRLLSLDYEKLSKLNISIPGFGKTDVIKEYDSLYAPIKKSKIEKLFE